MNPKTIGGIAERKLCLKLHCVVTTRKYFKSVHRFDEGGGEEEYTHSRSILGQFQSHKIGTNSNLATR